MKNLATTMFSYKNKFLGFAFLLSISMNSLAMHVREDTRKQLEYLESYARKGDLHKLVHLAEYTIWANKTFLLNAIELAEQYFLLAIHQDKDDFLQARFLLEWVQGLKKEHCKNYKPLVWNDSFVKEFYYEAAEANVALAQYRIGIFYLKNASSPNTEEGIMYLKKAAHNRYTRAQYELAQFYFDSNEKYYSDALKYLKLAANHEEDNLESREFRIVAQRDLAKRYFHGKGVKENKEKAVTYWKRLANNYDQDGMFFLAQCYEYGFGIDKNIRRAIALYKKCSGEYRIYTHSKEANEALSRLKK